MKNGVYLPTGQNVVVIKEVNEYCEILIDSNFKMVSTMDINVIDFDYPLVSLEEFKSNVFLNILKNPVSDILYSYNSNRLVPEQHQYSIRAQLGNILSIDKLKRNTSWYDASNATIIFERP